MIFKKKNLGPRAFFFIIIGFLATFSTVHAQLSLGELLPLPRGETSLTPEIVRSALQLLGPTTSTSSQKNQQPQSESPQQTTAAETQSLGPNLIPNPSVETAGASGLPQNWFKGGYGVSTRTLTYPVAGQDGAKGIQVAITNYTTGDAKWFFSDVPVTGGSTYQFSDFYQSNVPSILTARFKHTDGSYSYIDFASLNSAGSYTQAIAQLTAPGTAVSVTIFHLIKQVGTLTTDNFSLREISSGSGNLISNSGFETSDTAGNPLDWKKGGWGTNTKVFSYPVAGINGSKAAKVAITSYTSGDAKWYFNPIPVSPGTYTYTTSYKSDVQTYITLQLENQDGTIRYTDIAVVLPSPESFTPVSIDFSIPPSVKTVIVFQLLKQVGELTIDNTSLTFKGAPQGIFSTGAVSFTFDDAWLSQYQNAVPKLNALGISGTFYIVTRQTADEGFSGYMSKAQIKEIYNQGHVIEAHTRTHRALSSLSSTEQQNEIAGSRNDLLAMNVGPILSFAYPFGDYNATTIQIVKNAGFVSARSTLDGPARSSSNPYELPRFSVEVNTTFAQVKQAIDNAIANKEWLILVFHQINNGTDRYTTSPQTFNQIADYVKAQNIRVVSVSEGVQSIQ